MIGSLCMLAGFFFFKQKTAYEMRISDWSSDVCSSDLAEADAYAARSHQRAAAAWRDGKFGDEVVAVPVPQRRGDPIMFDHDEGYRADATIETLAALKPLEGGVVPAGNASQPNEDRKSVL